MVPASFNSKFTLGSYRKTDAVIIVYQDNTRKMIEVAAVNAEAARITGYDNASLVSKPLAQVLPDRVNAIIEEYLDFANDQQDLQAVLGKVNNFSFKSATGFELPFQLKIIRGEAIDNNPWFHLVFADSQKLENANAFRNILKENFKGHEVVDARSGLPDCASLIKDMELVIYHVRNKEIAAAFALADINYYESLLKEYGQEVCDKLLYHIGQICKLKLRPEDTIGMISERTLGIILMDATPEAAHLVLNRLRWVINVTPLTLADKKELLAPVNITVAPMDGKADESQLLETCEAAIMAMRNKVNNSVQLMAG